MSPGEDRHQDLGLGNYHNQTLGSPHLLLLGSQAPGKNIHDTQSTDGNNLVKILQNTNLSVDLISIEMFKLLITQLPDGLVLVPMVLAAHIPLQSEVRAAILISRPPSSILDCLLKSSLWSIVQLKPNSDKKLKEIDRQEHLK